MIEKLTIEFIAKLEHEKGYSEHTLRAYHKDLSQFDTFLGDEKCSSLKRVNHLLLRKFLAVLRTNNYSKTTIARKLASIRSFFKYLIQIGELVSNPFEALRTPKQEKKLPHFLSISDVDVLLKTPDCSNSAGLRDLAMLETLYSTGIRGLHLHTHSDTALQLIYWTREPTCDPSRNCLAILISPLLRYTHT